MPNFIERIQDGRGIGAGITADWQAAHGPVALPPRTPAPVVTTAATRNPDFQRLADVVTSLYGSERDYSRDPLPVLVNPIQDAGDGGGGFSARWVGLLVVGVVVYLGWRWWIHRKGK